MILGIKLNERIEDAVKFQEILTEFGCNIRTRIGLHHGTQDACSNSGIVLLDIDGDNPYLISSLGKYWEVKVMEFNQ